MRHISIQWRALGLHARVEAFEAAGRTVIVLSDRSALGIVALGDRVLTQTQGEHSSAGEPGKALFIAAFR